MSILNASDLYEYVSNCCSEPNHTSILTNFMGMLILGFGTKNLILYYDQDTRSSLVNNVVQRALLAGVSLDISR